MRGESVRGEREKGKGKGKGWPVGPWVSLGEREEALNYLDFTASGLPRSDAEDYTRRMQNESLWRPLYPFNSHYFDLGPARMHFVDEGTGPILLMVHGNPTWSFYWRRLIQALRGKYRVIAVDHLGCGLSDKPQDGIYTLDQHIANLVALTDHLALNDITLVAHDWGDPLAWGPRWNAGIGFPASF